MIETSHWITGYSIPGEGRGTELGFPTANLSLPEAEDIPAEGIWACWARLEENPHMNLPGVLHIGPRPTFNDSLSKVELHLLHFPARDLYGQHISFQVIEKIRGVKHFPSADALIEAMTEDCIQAEKILNERASVAL